MKSLLLSTLAASAILFGYSAEAASFKSVVDAAASSPSATHAVAPILPASFIMPWFCLERCDNQTEVDFKQQIESIANINKRYEEGSGNFKIEAVAFEIFNLGKDGTLDVKPADNLWDINTYLRTERPNIGIKHRIAMVSSFPYPVEILNWTRALMANPKPFTDALIKELVEGDMDGVNIDLEPTAAATAEDAINYANFLYGLNKDLSAAPIRPRALTVAAANWSIFWNVPAIAKALVAHDSTPAGYFTSMNTYTANESIFEQQLAYNMESFGTNTPSAALHYGNLSPGLETDISNPASAKHHFEVLAKNSICQIAIWRMPIVDFFLEPLEDFGRRCMRK